MIRIEVSGTDVLARALGSHLRYIDEHRNITVVQGRVGNAITLSKQCMVSHPDAVRGIVQTLKRLLKRRGDKNAVLEVAELALDAARRSGRTDDDVSVEAHAVICGRSWVYQRIERLEEARVYAQKSLDLGEQVSWDRNTACCKKCTGRLLRMDTERQEQGLPTE